MHATGVNIDKGPLGPFGGLLIRFVLIMNGAAILWIIQQYR